MVILTPRQSLQFLAVKSFQILCPMRTPGHEDQELEDTALHRWLLCCLPWDPATVKRPQIFLCDLSDILFSHAGIPDACIPVVALGKCINKYIGKREKDSYPLGDFYQSEYKTKISVSHLISYSAPIQGRYSRSERHVCLKWWQLLLPK